MQLGRYVLAMVLSDMEHWQEFDQMWLSEEEELGEPVEPFQVPSLLRKVQGPAIAAVGRWLRQEPCLSGCIALAC